MEIDVRNLNNNSLDNIRYLDFLLEFKQPTTEQEKLSTIHKIESQRTILYQIDINILFELLCSFF